MNDQDNKNVHKTPIKEERPVGRLKYFLTRSETKVKVVYFIALAIGLVFSFTLFASGSMIISTPMTDIPVVDMLISEETIKSLDGSVKEFTAQIDETIAEGDTAKIAELEAKFGMELDDLKKTMQNLSIKSITTLVNGLSEAEAEKMSDVGKVLNIISAIIIGFGIFLGSLALLSVAVMKKGLLIAVYIISSAYLFLLVGIIPFIIVTACGISYVTITTVLNSEYKKYKSKA